MESFFIFGGVTILAALFARLLVERLRIPSIVLYLLLGVAANALNIQFHWINQQFQEGLNILGEMGIIILLFRVGLQSNIQALMSQLKKASLIWIGNVSLSAALGYVTAHYILHFSALSSLFVAVALSATSVGVPAAIWQASNRLNSEEGALLIDVAELDDISAIILMALLFSLVPTIAAGHTVSFETLFGDAGFLVLKFLGFVGICYLFSMYLEEGFTSYLKSKSLTSTLIAIIGVTFIISGLANWLGFSLAIGAIFAGFAFSRDPAGMDIDKELETVFQLFVPFFFINIGLGVKLNLIGLALLPGLILLVAAVLGKIIGTGVPALFFTSKQQALLLGISMVPRAEIDMVIMLYGYQSKPQIISPQLFGAMVVVSLLSCLLTPPVLHYLFAQSSVPYRKELNNQASTMTK